MTLPTWDDGEYFDLACSVGRCRRYHARMHAFYQGWHDAVAASNAILGAGAFVSLLGSVHPAVPVVLTAIIAISNAVETVLKPVRKAELHADLGRRFTLLASEIAKSEPTPKALAALSAKRLVIEADEPPVRRLADLVAQNDEWAARGIANRVPVTKLQASFLGCGFTFGMRRLEEWRDARVASAPSESQPSP